MSLVSKPRASDQDNAIGKVAEGDMPALTMRPSELATHQDAAPSPAEASTPSPAETEAAAAAANLPRVIVREATTVRCTVCLEVVPAAGAACPECGETFGASDASPPSSGGPWSGLPASLRAPENASWLRLHWRPIVTVGMVTALICTGVALRELAPDRHAPAAAASVKQAQMPVCQPACWNGEACTVGQCVWQKPNDVGHVSADPVVSGPFSMPKDVSDALPIDAERFAVALLGGTRIQSARTGEVQTILNDTPQSRRLYRVGDAVYVTAPQRIYVVDAGNLRLLKTIEMGETVTEIAVGGSGRRVLASMPAAHSVAVIATEYHAEIERISFGDDTVGPVGIDDSGKRALTTTGSVPLPGLRDPQGGAAYAFDPTRLASAQDRVRTSMVGNPVSVLMTPDGATSYVVLRAEDQIVPLEWLPSGAVRRKEGIHVCREPEQIELLRKGRRALVRCNEGRALEVIDLSAGRVVEHIALNARPADMAVSPDGEQAVIALPDEANSGVGFVDLQSYDVKVLPVGAEPTRVRMAPNGSAALVLSDRAKAVWVLR
jgi:DNA-binding beta-propeller fold protein YncE